MTSTISAGWTRVELGPGGPPGQNELDRPGAPRVFEATAHGAQPIGPLGMPRSGEVGLAGRVHLDDDGESGHRL